MLSRVTDYIYSFFSKKDDTDILSDLIFKDTDTYQDDFTEAITFIKNNPAINFNFYREYSFRGFSFSLIQIATLVDQPLLIAILQHPIMKNPHIHNHKFYLDQFLSKNKNSVLTREFFKKNLMHMVSVTKKDHKNFVSSLYGNENLIEQFRNFPIKDMWRLFIDVEKAKKENGWLDFELREPGYLTGMLKGWEYIKDHIEDNLTVEMVKKSHFLCTAAIENMSKGTNPGTFRNSDASTGLSKTSLGGIIELVESPNHGKHYTIRHEVELQLLDVTSESLAQELTKIFQDYQEKINQCAEPSDKLSIIVALISTLERLHPFIDGNTRVFSMLILNKELMRYGFSPVILENPNYFVEWSQDELYNEIINGMENFQQVKNNDILKFGIDDSHMEDLLANDPKYLICKKSHEALINLTRVNSQLRITKA